MQINFSRILVFHLVLAAVLFSLHHWVALAVARGDYTPFGASREVSSMTFDETHAYAPPALRFMTFGRVPAEVDDYELRDRSAGVPFLPAAILGGIGRLLGSLEWSFIVADVVFPALALGLFYFASGGIVESPTARLLIAWSVLLIPFGPRNFLWSGYDARLAAPDFTRTPQPEISFPLACAAAMLTAGALRLAGKARVVAAGLASALVVYSYYFYTIAWGMALGMLLLLAVVWRNWRAAKRTAAVIAIMMGGAVPFVMATLHGRNQGGQTNLLMRMGSYTHAAHPAALLVFAAGLLAMWRFGRMLMEGAPEQARTGVFTLLLLAGVAGLNFQIISGYDAQHAHFWNRMILPVGCFLAGCLLFSRTRISERVAWAALLCILVNAAARQVYVGTRIAGVQKASRPETELLVWAREHLPAESVIGALDPELILMIPAIAPDFSYAPAGGRSLASSREIRDRYYHLASLAGLSEEQILAIAAAPGHFGSSQLAVVLGHPGTAQSFAADYAHYQDSDSGRRLDYLVLLSARKIPQSVARRYPEARVVHTNSKYEVIAL